MTGGEEKRKFPWLMTICFAFSLSLLLSGSGCGEDVKVRCSRCPCDMDLCPGTDSCCDSNYPYLCEANGKCYVDWSDCDSECPE